MAVKAVTRWSKEAFVLLQSFFEVTNWQTLWESQGEDTYVLLTELITDYIRFCAGIIPIATVYCYPNSKLWVTKDIKFHERKMS